MPEPLLIQEILVWLRELIAELVEIDVMDVAVDSDLVNGLYIESLQQLELMNRVEQRLRIAFDIEVWLTSATVEELAEYIIAKQQRRDDR